IQTSLEKLGLDYVDLYLIHWPTPAKDNYVEAWLALEEIKAKGWSKSIGVSNFLEDHLRRVVAESSTVPAVNQIELHPTFSQEPLVAVNSELGIVTQSYSPLGLSKDLANPDIQELASKLGRTPAQVILRWHIQKGYVVFPKSVTPERIEENFKIFDFELSAEDMAAIDAVNVDARNNPHPNEFN